MRRARRIDDVAVETIAMDQWPLFRDGAVDVFERFFRLTQPLAALAHGRHGFQIAGFSIFEPDQRRRTGKMNQRAVKKQVDNRTDVERRTERLIDLME